jgi:hypothetical protein
VTAPAVSAAIEVPGVYDIPADHYHSDPVPGGSLSSSGAKRLLPPSCPALFHHWTTAGQEHKQEFDFGHAAHALVLGVGAPIVVIDAGDWRTKAAREERDAAHATGATPLLRADYDQVIGMATALRQHPIASALFQPGNGKAEQTLVWVDDESGVWRRAMLDWLPEPTGARLVVPDYKTCKSAEPGALARVIHQYAYIQQAPWYLDGVEALGLSPDGEPAFVFVFQEKTPPYLVTVAQPDPDALQWGRVLNRKALDLYREHTATGHWPGYADSRVISLSIPGWADHQHQLAYERGDYDVEGTSNE